MVDGEDREMRELFAAHHEALLAHAQRICRRRDLAEEVCQDAWIAIARGLHRFEGRSSIRWWMTRIVANRAFTQVRKESRFVPTPLVDNRVDGLTPEAVAVGAELGSLVERTLEEMPVRQRRVFEMRQVEGRSAEDVCEAMAVSPTNQRVLLHRARKHVRRALSAAAG